MGAGILCAGCGGKDHKVQEVPADEKAYGEEITLMHPDADKAEFPAEAMEQIIESERYACVRTGDAEEKM